MARVVDLVEYRDTALAPHAMSEACARAIHASFKEQVSVTPPSFLTKHNWILTSQGWVGFIPLTEDLHLRLHPKVPMSNLFRMLEYAYFHEFRVLDGMTDALTITEVYERLAVVLARRVRDRMRRGLHRSYVGHDEELPYLRGRLDALAHLRRPLGVTLPCRYEEHTSDLEDNQILLWTLTRLLDSRLCSEATTALLRQTRRALIGQAQVRPFAPRDCVGRRYDRLNADYEPMHALCRFFLEHTGPTHQGGDHDMLPILVNMETLFEQFVVAWLERHLPDCYAVRAQEHMEFGADDTIRIRIDITLIDVASGRTCYVLDTKYKKPDKPAAGDFEQIVAYAVAKDCRRAALVYPKELTRAVRGWWGRDIEFDTLTFALDGDLEHAGSDFLRRLISQVEADRLRQSV